MSKENTKPLYKKIDLNCIPRFTAYRAESEVLGYTNQSIYATNVDFPSVAMAISLHDRVTQEFQP